MTPHYADVWLTVYSGDCREVLPTLEAESVDCIVTSPPYWGLRDYGQDGQLGLESTPEEYVANLVAVFRELRRVLKPSGTCWLNLGDSYNGPASGRTRDDYGTTPLNLDDRTLKYRLGDGHYKAKALKQKDLVGIPWRVAFALQADGWWLRSDIIWSKPNAMPESVTDRPTRTHEYLFLLTKAARYYFDAEAVRESATTESWTFGNNGPTGQHVIPGQGYAVHRPERAGGRVLSNGRNIRSVWTVATRPYPGAHFAVFPPELPERCIKAGSPSGGVILDPFAGSGTVGMVAQKLNRRAILIDLNPDYIAQQMKRNAQTPLGLVEPEEVA